MATFTVRLADSPYQFTFAGKANPTFSGKSAEGNKVGSDNGGGPCLFAGAIDLALQEENGNVGVTVVIPAGGSEQNLTITGYDGSAAGVLASSGRNGDNEGIGGELVYDDYFWLASSTNGADGSVTGSGADGEVTFTWDEVATSSPAAYFSALQGVV